MRGVFAILVVIAHALEMAVLSFDSPFFSTALGGFLRDTVGKGFYWVMGFFVISGFCIHLSVRNSYARGQYSARNYMIARITRIAPLFYIALFIALLTEFLVLQLGVRPPVWVEGVNVRTFVGNVFFTQSITGWFGSFAPAWSITCEMAYYIMWPAVLWVFGYRAAYAALGGAFAAFLIAIALFAMDTDGFGMSLTPYWMLFYMSVLWFAGAFLAAVWEYAVKSEALRKLSYLWMPGLIVVFVLENSGVINMHIRNLMLCPVFICMLLNLQVWPEWLLGREEKAEMLGNLSYLTYLLHGPLLLLCGAAIMAMGLQLSIAISFAMMVAFVLLVGGYIGIPLEVRLLAWRKNVQRLSAGRI